MFQIIVSSLSVVSHCFRDMPLSSPLEIATATTQCDSQGK